MKMMTSTPCPKRTETDWQVVQAQSRPTRQPWGIRWDPDPREMECNFWQHRAPWGEETSPELIHVMGALTSHFFENKGWGMKRLWRQGFFLLAAHNRKGITGRTPTPRAHQGKIQRAARQLCTLVNVRPRSVSVLRAAVQVTCVPSDFKHHFNWWDLEQVSLFIGRKI